MYNRNSLIFYLFTITVSILVAPTSQAAHAARKAGHQERAEDGAFSPRDHAHHGGADEHDDHFDHEAILGSKKDAEEFDDLPPEEAKRRLRVLLTKMDRNGDENIDRNELYAWILRSFKSLSEEDSKDRFEDADEDEDSFVTWEEYKSEEYDFDEEDFDLNDPEMAEELKMVEEDKYLFNAADIDGDGKLSITEFLSFTHPEEDANMRPHVLEQVLSSKDLDGDGQLTFQEFVGERGEGKDKEWLITEKERFDEELDKNGDNVLNKEEILAWIIPSNEEIANDEVDHLFSGSDEDVDGKLSFEEVLNNHDLFVGSEATDYGDHLHNLDRFEDEL